MNIERLVLTEVSLGYFREVFMKQPPGREMLLDIERISQWTKPAPLLLIGLIRGNVHKIASVVHQDHREHGVRVVVVDFSWINPMPALPGRPIFL